jgi:hypothetical protein
MGWTRWRELEGEGEWYGEWSERWITYYIILGMSRSSHGWYLKKKQKNFSDIPRIYL